MNLNEAIQSAKEGNFVSNEYFSPDQSMHYYNGKFYYEDGAVVPLSFLESQAFAQNGEWYVKYSSSNIDVNYLDSMHRNVNGYMLVSPESYENCIKK